MAERMTSKSLVGRAIAGNRPGRSMFDLSHSVLLTGDMGQLIPVLCDEVVPGDYWRIGTDVLIRLQPLVAPIMHEIRARVDYWYVPYRILDDQWETIITGGPDGQDVTALPRWAPSADKRGVGSLWDYLGFPAGVDPVGAYPIDYPRRAYARVWNEAYRDENLQTKVAETNEDVLNRCWTKDYFASALPWQQRGTAPALPLTGTTNAEFTANLDHVWPAIWQQGQHTLYGDPNTHAPYDNNTKLALEAVADHTAAQLSANVVDFKDAGTFSVADLRLQYQIQRWMELNARGGVRYTEFLKAHYGVSPTDSRLDRPEYIGGVSTPVIVSEVLQTSSTDATSPQANMAGHGITVDQQFAGSYRVDEFGLIIGLLSVMPAPLYSQGIDRQWLRRSRYDFYSPEFAYLSEQGIERAELFASGVEAENRDIWGFAGRYDEMRIKRNRIAGLMRTDLAHWHLGRSWASYPALNAQFVSCDSVTGGADNPLKRIFAVPSEPGLICHIGHRIAALRPLPMVSEPGLVDHTFGGR